MLDLGQSIATPRDRIRAAAVAVALVCLGLGALPYAEVRAGESYSLFAVIIALSIGAVGLTSLLLWAQARVTCSLPLTVLSLGYGMTALAMVPYLVLYHGLWPAVALHVSASPSASGWLWLVWHSLFIGSTIAYHYTRRNRLDNPDRATFVRSAGRLAWGAAGILLVVIPSCIWIEGLPAFSLHDRRTTAALVSVVAIIAGGVVSIGLGLRSNRYRATLDWWLAVVCMAIVLDVTLSQVALTPFTVGWYVSRLDILVAAGALLVVMLFQTARIYAQLAVTAERLQVESLTDALTGLVNRRGFDLRLDEALRAASRTLRPTALLMIDIDNFKSFNDTFGHQAGDDCLRVVAEILRTSAGRSRDVIARIGGEELAVVMAETDAEGALTVARRMQEAVAAFELRQGRGAMHGVVTISVGVAATSDFECTDARALVLQADRALYRAKGAGRNCVVAAESAAAVSAA